MVTFLENLISARDQYAAKLAAIHDAPDGRWNEYEEFVLAQIERLNRQIEAARATAIADQSEVISGGYTP